METHHRPSWKMKIIFNGRGYGKFWRALCEQKTTQLFTDRCRSPVLLELSLRRIAVSNVTAWSGGSPQALLSKFLLSPAILKLPAAWLLEFRWKSLMQKSLEHSWELSTTLEDVDFSPGPSHGASRLSVLIPALQEIFFSVLLWTRCHDLRFLFFKYWVLSWLFHPHQEAL